MPNDATVDTMMNIRTVDDFSGAKSINGGFGVRMCVFFSLTCGWRGKMKLLKIVGFVFLAHKLIGFGV